MSSRRYLRVVNREKFQHYTKRNPPWIKLHRALITGEDKQLDDFLLLNEQEQWQLVRVWLLASQCEGFLMLYDEPWVRRAIRSVRRVPLEKFVRDGWLEPLSEEAANTLRVASTDPPETDADASTVLAKDPVFTPPENTEVTEVTEEVLFTDEQRRIRLLTDQTLKGMEDAA